MNRTNMTRINRLEDRTSTEKHAITVTRRYVERDEGTGALFIASGLRYVAGSQEAPEILDRDFFKDEVLADPVFTVDKNSHPRRAAVVPVAPSEKEMLARLLKSNPNLMDDLASLVAREKADEEK